MAFPNIFSGCGRIGNVSKALLILASIVYFPAPVQAGDLKAFNESVSGAYRSYRGALFYLRTGNLSVATLELEDMQDSWRAVMARFVDAPPDAFADDPGWRETLRDIGARADKALDAADTGDVKKMTSIIGPVRGMLAALRARNGVYVFSDCIDEANAVGKSLLALSRRPYKFDDQVWVNRLRGRAAVVTYVYEKCRGIAPEALREDDGFKRLVDGAAYEMVRIEEAIVTKNSRLLAISLGEFRSFDRMLFLNFG